MDREQIVDLPIYWVVRSAGDDVEDGAATH
jgi:hypothetical protein